MALTMFPFSVSSCKLLADLSMTQSARKPLFKWNSHIDKSPLPVPLLSADTLREDDRRYMNSLRECNVGTSLVGNACIHYSLMMPILQGYPGTVQASITYILRSDKSLRTIFEATTDKMTPINMAQHSYFNLSGHSGGPILGHRLRINGWASH